MATTKVMCYDDIIARITQWGPMVSGSQEYCQHVLFNGVPAILKSRKLRGDELCVWGRMMEARMLEENNGAGGGPVVLAVGSEEPMIVISNFRQAVLPEAAGRTATPQKKKTKKKKQQSRKSRK